MNVYCNNFDNRVDNRVLFRPAVMSIRSIQFARFMVIIFLLNDPSGKRCSLNQDLCQLFFEGRF